MDSQATRPAILPVILPVMPPVLLPAVLILAIRKTQDMAFKTLGQGDPDAEGAIMAEINITPLTDIFLVLLIIFMVTSSVMSQSGVDVNLPQASSATSQSQPEGIIITLLPEGKMR